MFGAETMKDARRSGVLSLFGQFSVSDAVGRVTVNRLMLSSITRIVITTRCVQRRIVYYDINIHFNCSLTLL